MKRRNAELKPEKKIARAEINDWNGEKNKVKKNSRVGGCSWRRGAKAAGSTPCRGASPAP